MYLFIPVRNLVTIRPLFYEMYLILIIVLVPNKIQIDIWTLLFFIATICTCTIQGTTPPAIKVTYYETQPSKAS